MIKADLAYVEHILDCIRKIKEFSGVTSPAIRSGGLLIPVSTIAEIKTYL